MMTFIVTATIEVRLRYLVEVWCQWLVIELNTDFNVKQCKYKLSLCLT